MDLLFIFCKRFQECDILILGDWILGFFAEWGHYKHSADRVKLRGEGDNLWLCVQHRSTSLRFSPCKKSNQIQNGVEICIKLNMDNVWWYHKPCSCSNSSLFELDDSWFVEAIQYFVTCSELSLSLIYSCTVYQSTYLNTFLLWITGGQESVVYHVNSGTDFRRGQDCQVVCPENCWCLCVVSLP